MQACFIVKKEGFFHWRQLILLATGSYLWHWHPRKEFRLCSIFFSPIALYYTRCANPKVVWNAFFLIFSWGDEG